MFKVPLNKSDGMVKECVINLDTITTIRKELLDSKIAELTPEKAEQVNEAIRFALAIK